MLALLALYLGRLRHLSFPDGLAVVDAIESVPALIGEALKTEPAVEEAAERIAAASNALYLGRDLHFPVALEGALKLKEISYIHAEGYPTAEMKHGPIALVDRETPCVFVAPRGSLHAKTLSNIEEVRARNGLDRRRRHRGRRRRRRSCPTSSCRSPRRRRSSSRCWRSSRSQLLAYHVARRRGCDIDKPRNLAKSVTVE